MLVEHFRSGGAGPGAARNHIASWADESRSRRFQPMECGDRTLIDGRIAEREDPVEFEVYPVMTSAEAFGRVFVYGARTPSSAPELSTLNTLTPFGRNSGADEGVRASY